MARGQPIDQNGWPEDRPRRTFFELLDKVHREHGTKSLSAIAEGMNLRARSRVSRLLRGTLPADEDQVSDLIRALGGSAGEIEQGLMLYRTIQSSSSTGTVPVPPQPIGLSDGEVAVDGPLQGYVARAGVFRTPAPVSRAVMTHFCWRLGDSWKELADFFEVAPHEREGFRRGNEPRDLWRWLEVWDKLPLVPEGLMEIGREELAALLLAESARDVAGDVTDFTALIDEHTHEFVGRRWFGERLWGALDDDTFDSGYLFVYGEPGIGKTALLAQLVRERNLVHHFNSVLTGVTSREQFLRNVCAQLILRYELPDERLPADAMAHSGVLLDLLGRAAARNNRVLVAIDAIDEAVAAENAENRLFLPPALPPGVFFVVTMRDPEDVELYVDEPRHLPLLEADAENQADIREYIAAFLTRHGLAMTRRLKELGVQEAEFGETIADRSEGNFMYVRHVLRGIRYGTLGGIDPGGIGELPRGLRAYYAHLEQQLLRRTGDDPGRELAILGVLASWPSPLTRQRLARFAGESVTLTSAVLRRWSPFLNEVHAGREPSYALYHASFRDYLGERLDMDAVRERIGAAIEAELT